MSIIVTKFGGSSLASGSQMEKVKNILMSDRNRHYVVPSAPGKRFDGDSKVTDLLLKLNQDIEFGGDYMSVFEEITERFVSIKEELGLDIDIEARLKDFLNELLNGAGAEYSASRGEYFNGLLLASYLGWDFIDAKDVIKFDKRGKYSEEVSLPLLRKELKKHEYAVIPGFYGSLPDGRIHTFPRGGSDISGAIVAAGCSADLYENWTDVSGFLMADPRIVKNPKSIDFVTYRELRELSYMGAQVLHEDSIFPVYNAAIPINVRNTNDPSAKWTMIVPMIEHEEDRKGITGIAGKKNFTIISIEKNGMNSELGFGRKVLSCIEKYGVSFEHMPSGIDTLCVVLQDSSIEDTLHDLVDDIHRICKPDSIEVFSNIALIATVGRGMIRQIGTAATIFGALAEAKINIRMIDQGSSEMNIIVGVGNNDFDRAIRSIYEAFIRQMDE
ncbi:MAG: aspartate kinase [Christensenellaceae bacterium]|nr:aspartate kinase [Christensenellaceae bacterium]